MGDTLTITAKNVSEGPRILNALPPIILQPGKSTDGPVEITEPELESMEATGYFEITLEGSADDDGDLTKNTVDELKAFAVAENIDLGTASKKAEIIEAILKARSE